LPVCLSICTEQPSSQWMDFHEIWYILKICWENQILIKALQV
jgi:hypothetical protein